MNMHNLYVCIKKFEDTNLRFPQYQLTISSIPYWLMISSILLHDFVFWLSLSRILKTGLRNMDIDIGSRI